ncbi:tetratricopeptide repeat protein [Cryptosporangium japonicum]|uniref:Tetratricopeptide repeat protein n=1 Tax=Cryptosporangium japonicum TaxID=80872 RepID=A0ABN0TGU3_9ACTN
MGFAEEVRAAFRRGDTATVTLLARSEVERARETGDPAGEVEALYALSRVALREEDLPRAGQLAEAALVTAVAAGDRALEERPRHVLAAVARLSGDLVTARERYRASIALNEELGRPGTVTSETYNLAFTELHLGDLARARDLFAAVRRRATDPTMRAYLGIGAAALSGAEGDHERAAFLLGSTDAAFAALGQVPDPDDAGELARVRAAAVAALGEDGFRGQHARGYSQYPGEVG